MVATTKETLQKIQPTQIKNCYINFNLKASSRITANFFRPNCRYCKFATNAEKFGTLPSTSFWKKWVFGWALIDELRASPPKSELSFEELAIKKSNDSGEQRSHKRKKLTLN